MSNVALIYLTYVTLVIIIFVCFFGTMKLIRMLTDAIEELNWDITKLEHDVKRIESRIKSKE